MRAESRVSCGMRLRAVAECAGQSSRPRHDRAIHCASDMGFVPASCFFAVAAYVAASPHSHCVCVCALFAVCGTVGQLDCPLLAGLGWPPFASASLQHRRIQPQRTRPHSLRTATTHNHARQAPPIRPCAQSQRATSSCTLLTLHRSSLTAPCCHSCTALSLARVASIDVTERGVDLQGSSAMLL